MAIPRRASDIDLRDAFDLSEFRERKEKKHRQELKDIWYALDGLPAIKVTPEMIIDRITEKHADSEVDHAEELEAANKRASRLDDELDELKEEHTAQEKDYHNLFNEHEELKNLCWSAFELEPDTIQSLKDWLKKHDS